LCALVALALAGTVPAQAVDGDSQPLDRTVSYGVYDDPNDPGRVLIWLVVFHLEETVTVGGQIGWTVEDIHVFDVANGPDGLWWVSHADVEVPELQEFDMPPYVEGLAACEDSEEPDLEYELEGQVYTAPPGGPHFAIAAALDLRFWEQSEPAPLIVRENEPVEVNAREYPPIGQ
jgi:hypothetical protein